MPYQPNLYNDVDFNFVVDAYTPPKYNSVVFVFGSFATAQFQLNQQWAVEGQSGETTHLNQQWGTYVIETETFKLNQQWATVSYSFELIKLDQQWDTQAASGNRLDLNQRWVTDALGSELFYSTRQWISPGITISAWLSTEQWATTGAAEKLDLVQQWNTIGVTASEYATTQQWNTLGVSTDQFLHNQRWVTTVPGNETFFNTESWYCQYGVAAGLIVKYGNVVGLSFNIVYDLGRTRVQQQLVMDYNLSTRAIQELVVDSNLNRVQQQLIISYLTTDAARQALNIVVEMLQRVRQQLVIDSDLDKQKVAQQLILQQDIVGTNRVANELVVVYMIAGAPATVQSESQPTVVVNGQVVAVTEVEVSIDEGQFAWTCHMTLADVDHYSLFNPEDEFTIDLDGETYTFILDSKSLSRSGQVTMTASISGISPSAVLADPRAEKITKTWETATLVTDIADEMVGAYGIDWRILDWSLPAYRLGVESQNPMDVLQLIAKAAGGMVETEPDGTLYVRYHYPVSVVEYQTTTPDQLYSDLDHNFSLQENMKSQKVVNKLRILDVADDAKRDHVEFVQDEDDYTKGFLKVFPSPWRETIEVDHTSLPSVSATLVGVETEDLEEVVEVVNGKGSVSHPIYSIQSITWLYANLTGISFESDTNEFKTTHPTNKESLVKINYRTRYIRFNVGAFSDAQVQFLVKDVS